MKKLIPFFILSILFCFACETANPLQKYGEHYQQHQDFKSLNKVVELLPPNTDTSAVKKLLGEPINMGFDYRYLVDSTGENGCVVGAVFHIDSENGKIDQQWVGEICE